MIKSHAIHMPSLYKRLSKQGLRKSPILLRKFLSLYLIISDKKANRIETEAIHHINLKNNCHLRTHDYQPLNRVSI